MAIDVERADTVARTLACACLSLVTRVDTQEGVGDACDGVGETLRMASRRRARRGGVLPINQIDWCDVGRSQDPAVHLLARR